MKHLLLIHLLLILLIFLMLGAQNLMLNAQLSRAYAREKQWQVIVETQLTALERCGGKAKP